MHSSMLDVVLVFVLVYFAVGAFVSAIFFRAAVRFFNGIVVWQSSMEEVAPPRSFWP